MVMVQTMEKMRMGDNGEDEIKEAVKRKDGGGGDGNNDNSHAEAGCHSVCSELTTVSKETK